MQCTYRQCTADINRPVLTSKVRSHDPAPTATNSLCPLTSLSPTAGTLELMKEIAVTATAGRGISRPLAPESVVDSIATEWVVLATIE
jgi:hypothetical protein